MLEGERGGRPYPLYRTEHGVVVRVLEQQPREPLVVLLILGRVLNDVIQPTHRWRVRSGCRRRCSRDEIPRSSTSASGSMSVRMFQRLLAFMVSILSGSTSPSSSSHTETTVVGSIPIPDLRAVSGDTPTN